MRNLLEKKGENHKSKIISKTGHDLIGGLPDELLCNILSRLPAEEVIRTSIISKRWVDLWKYTPNLKFDLQNMTELRSDLLSQTVRRIMRNCSRGRIHVHRNYSIWERYINGKIKERILEQEEEGITNHVFEIEMSPMEVSKCKLYFHQKVQYNVSPPVCFRPCIFHLELNRFKIETRRMRYLYHQNLRTLKLIWVFIKSKTLNEIIVNSPNLEELIIRYSYNLKSGLKIKNDNLKSLELSCLSADEIEVSATGLEVLILDSLRCPYRSFSVNAPKIQFNRNFMVGPHLYIACDILKDSENVPTNIPENEIVGYKQLKNNSRAWRNVGNLAINVDLKNKKEVRILSNFLKRSARLRILELRIKENHTPIEDEDIKDCPSLIWGSRFWQNQRAFACLKKRKLEFVMIYDFNGEAEEIAFATYFVTKATALKSMTIQYKACASERATAAARKLLALPKASKKLIINLKPESAHEPK